MTLDVTTILAPVFWAMIALVGSGPAAILMARALGARAQRAPARHPSVRRAPRPVGRRTSLMRHRGGEHP